MIKYIYEVYQFIFICLLKMSIEGLDLIFSGIECHGLGAAKLTLSRSLVFSLAYRIAGRC